MLDILDAQLIWSVNLWTKAWNIKPGPHIVYVCKLQLRHMTVMMMSLLKLFYQLNISDIVIKFKVNWTCRTWYTKSCLHFVSGL